MQPSYTLYYKPATCALAVHAVLNAIGAPYRLSALEGDEQYGEAYLKLNPLGQVPVLLENDAILKESGAIMIHLLDTYNHPLLPQSGSQRTSALQWLLFFNSTMHQIYGAYFLIQKNIKDGTVTDPVLGLIVKRMNKLWRYVEAELQTPFLCGDAPTAADILMAVIANWTHVITPRPVLGEKTKAACRSVAQLPYFAQALKEENISVSY